MVANNTESINFNFRLSKIYSKAKKSIPMATYCLITFIDPLKFKEKNIITLIQGKTEYLTTTLIKDK